MMKTIHPKELAGSPGGVLLDVRTPAEYDELHIPGSILQPLHDLNPTAIATMANGKDVYVLCNTGNRARLAVEQLDKLGIGNVMLVEGGLSACEVAGLPLKRGRKTISLERQVRIAAGLLIMLGTALGFTVHSAFYALAGLVGAGLVFAGVTDSCGLEMALARMPWNKKVCESGCRSSCNSNAQPFTTSQ